MFKLRHYQQGAVDAAMLHIMKCRDSALLDLATGAGKSIIIAEIAKQVAKRSGKRVLCVAPSKELVTQNREKYLAMGEPASVFSASAGAKCLKHDVVFGSPLTIINNIEKFGSKFAMVVIDEAHNCTPTIRKMVESMRSANPNLRVLGLTATPYRMNTGYIYELKEDGSPVGEDKAVNPFYKKLLFSVPAEQLIREGFLTHPTTTAVPHAYDTSSLEIKSGKFTADSIERVFTSEQRLTHEIVNQVVDKTQDRMGVMFFASTIQHAEEITRSLPPGSFALVTGKTPKKEREKIICDFKSMQFKYLVNVSVLTTGFDAPHIDAVAILRATESASLLQQIIGRGLRLHDNKADCLVMDFAENIERHGLEDDLFNPEIKTFVTSSEKTKIDAKCSVCGFTNQFSARPNKEGLEIDSEGYFVDLMGKQIIDEATNKPFPAHFGRRCEAQELVDGSFVRCGARWSFKECPHENCGAENDIAAKYCFKCKGELIDPNDKLKIEFKKIKKSPYEPTSDKIASWFAQHHKTKAGKIVLKINWTTDFRTFDVYYDPLNQKKWVPLCHAVFGKVANSVDEFIEMMRRGLATPPRTITSSKKKNARFVDVFNYNAPEDIEA